MGAFKMRVKGPDKNATTAALAASLVVRADGGRLFAIDGYNGSASDQYIQVFDAAALPANGTVPKMVMPVPAGSYFTFYWPMGKPFTTGIVICNSSTAATKTIGSADCLFDADHDVL